MKKLILIIALFFIIGNLFANEEFQKANEYYKNGQYSNAIDAYKALIDRGNVSANIYFNLANSYFKLNKLADAILYYERAKKLSPNDEDIDFNLKVANLRIIDKIEPTPKFFLTEWYENIISTFTSSGWSWLSIGFFWLSLSVFALLLFVFKGKFKKAFLFGSFGLFIIAILFSIIAYLKFSQETNSKFGIVYKESVYVKSSPDEKSTDLFILHEGTKIEILNELQDWYQIKLLNGSVGWVNLSELEKI